MPAGRRWVPAGTQADPGTCNGRMVQAEHVRVVRCYLPIDPWWCGSSCGLKAMTRELEVLFGLRRWLLVGAGHRDVESDAIMRVVSIGILQFDAGVAATCAALHDRILTTGIRTLHLCK